MWSARGLQPLRDAGLDREPHLYTGGTWGPQQAEELTRSRGGWVDPA